MQDSKSTLSFIGIALGSIALLLAIVHFWAGPFSPQTTIEQRVAEKVVSIKKATIAALNGKQTPVPESRSIDIDQIVSIGTAILGGLAIIFAVIGFAKKEPLRAAGGAIVLGGSAIAFQFFVFALGAIILAILIGAVLSQIGIG